MLKRALLALSLANLSFLGVWEELLTTSPFHYFLSRPPSRLGFLAAPLNVVVFAVVLWIVATLVLRFFSQRSRAMVNGLAVAVLLVVIVNAVQRSRTLEFIGYDTFSAIKVVCVLGPLVVAWRRPESLLRIAEVGLVVASPFVVVTFSQSLWSLVDYSAVVRRFSGLELTPVTGAVRVSAPRVVWIVFDELDQQVAFDERPDGLELPEFDRFRAQAINATQALPVAGETDLAMPALITGKRVSRARPVAGSTLLITLAETQDVVEWARQPSIFSKARAAGFNTGVVGFHHPYCRVLSGSLSSCSSWSSDLFPKVWTTSAVFTLPESMVIQLSVGVAEFPMADRLRLPQRFLSNFETIGKKRAALPGYPGMVDQAKKMASDASLGLVMIHLSVPHPPFIFDRREGRYNMARKNSYLDNLVLADRSLGELRKAMEDAGLWERAAVLVMSDHWYRSKPEKPWLSQGETFALSTDTDHRVPFLLKLPGQQRETRYETPFNTILAHELILELLSNSTAMSDPEVVRRWMDHHRTVDPPLCNELKNVDHVCSPDSR